MSPTCNKKTDQSGEDEIRGYASPPCYQHELDPDYLGIAASDEQEQPNADSSWAAVREWRVETRSRLIAFREGLTRDELAKRRDTIINNLRDAGILSGHQDIGFYWPMPGEIDLRPLFAELVECGVDAALPAIAEKDQPLEFWHWRPGDDLDYSGPMGIPVPATRKIVKVTVLLIPLVGFDDQGHRLGHGGGYYDRTLAAMDPRPVAVGIGLDECRLLSIFPQAHDMPLDTIVTDARLNPVSHRLANGTTLARSE